MKQRLTETHIPQLKFKIEEAKGEVDGVHVLAKVSGEFFVPNGVSRNRRFYPESLWQKQLANNIVKQKLTDRIMFGTVGHDGEVNEKAIREGMTSHFMTKLWIENGKGMGECFIVNTDAGRNLNTLLRAGSKLRVSSRANGMFSGEYNGMPVVDEDNYDLEGWDFVIEAGFLEANPSIAEMLSKDLQKPKNSETLLITNRIGENMKDEKSLDTILVQNIVNENVELKTNIGKMKEELDAVKADKEAGDKKIADMEADDAEVSEKLAKLAKYEELGTPDEVEFLKKVAEEDKGELEKFKELGDSAEEVKESLELAKSHLKYISENFGTVPAIKKALTEAVNFKKEVDAIGTVTEIKESLSSYKAIVEAAEAEKKDKEETELAEELGLDKDKVHEMLKTQSPEQIRIVVGSIKENLTKKLATDRYAKGDAKVIVEGKEGEDKDADAEGDDKGEKEEKDKNESYASRSRADKLNEAFSR